VPASRPASFAASADDPPVATATPGEAGDQLDALAEHAVAGGVARMAALVAAGDLSGSGSVLAEHGRAELAGVLAAVMATADLLGRVRVLRLADGPPAKRFDDAEPTVPRGGLLVRSPEDALRYFLGLDPRLGIDPDRWGESLRRRAFTLAASTDEELTARVRDFLGGAVRDGRSVPRAAADLDALLDAAGVGPRQSGYAEMVVRTNALDAYTTAGHEQMRAPEVADLFPAWEYLAVPDSRSRKHHAARDGRLYPSSASFAAVRGTSPADVCNCRCSFRPVGAAELSRLVASGRTVETAW
jgi:SPP1 gp7 family putative phage head morphogenesis protein